MNIEVRAVFTIHNDTDHVITLSEPLKSCTCTDAELSVQEVLPGESCTLTVGIRTGDRRGPRVETVGLPYTSTGTTNGERLLARIYFTPKGVFEVEPSSVVLTRADPQKSFDISRATPVDAYRVLDVKPTHPCVKVDTSALPKVTVRLDTERAYESIVNAECVIYTNHPVESMIRVPDYAILHGVYDQSTRRAAVPRLHAEWG